MTPAELLIPRYKVIAVYPGSMFKINAILIRKQISPAPDDFEFIEEETSFGLFQYNPADYPAVFRKLEWYELRQEKDMPKYVKSLVTPKTVVEAEPTAVFGDIVKVLPIYMPLSRQFAYYDKTGRHREIKYKDCLPASEEEYNAFINLQKQTANGPNNLPA